MYKSFVEIKKRLNLGHKLIIHSYKAKEEEVYKRIGFAFVKQFFLLRINVKTIQLVVYAARNDLSVFRIHF